jgi:acyl-CoA synthetase (AMP-forming)/AMP-acid ligase II
MLRQPDFDRYDLSCVKQIVVGGSAATPALVREATERFGAPMSVRYSSTESGGVGCGTDFDAPLDVACETVGRPRRSVELSIRDEEGREMKRDEVGEICLRSPTVMEGYFRDPAATSSVFWPGRWLRTGDLGRVGGDGFLRIAGRIKEMYIRGGYNVYPVEVEAVLSSHPGVAAVAVVPRRDAVMGEVGIAVIVPRHRDRPPSLEELRAFATGRLAGYKLPEELRLVDALPLTSLDKIDRRRLQIEVGAPQVS